MCKSCQRRTTWRLLATTRRLRRGSSPTSRFSLSSRRVMAVTWPSEAAITQSRWCISTRCPSRALSTWCRWVLVAEGATRSHSHRPVYTRHSLICQLSRKSTPHWTIITIRGGTTKICSYAPAPLPLRPPLTMATTWRSRVSMWG